MAPPRVALLWLLTLSAGGCGILGGVSTPTVTVPTKLLDLGTVPVGDGKETRVRVSATVAERALVGAGAIVGVDANNVRIECVGSGPGYLDFLATTSRIVNCDGFGTTASVERDGVKVLNLEIKAKVRRAFELAPIVDGTRYELALAPGIALPDVIDHSAGLSAEIRPIGNDRAELVLRRTGPERVPGGMVRLVDRASGDMRLVRLPVSMERVGVLSERSGDLFDKSHDLTLSPDGVRRADAPGIEVVLDPPDAYRIVRRRAAGGKFAVVLRSLTRRPVDVTVGFRRNGRWIEVQRIHPD